MTENMFCTSINVKNLEYRAPTSNKSGGKVVHVSTVPGSYEWKDRIRFQMSEDQHTNLQTAIWGLSTPLPQQDATRRTLELTIESPALLSFLSALDDHNITTAQEKSEEWFKKKLDRDQIRNMYVPLVKTPHKEGEKPIVRVKVKCAEYPTNVYAIKDHLNFTYCKSNHEELTKNVKCMVLCETVGLWFMSRQFGMSLTASDIVVWPNKRPTGIQAFTFSQDTQLREDRQQEELGEEMDLTVS